MKKKPQMPKMPVRDPERAYVRRKTAARQAGRRHCACGERRPKALVPDRDPIICLACDRKQRGQSAIDDHHIAGMANSPVTVPVNVNDHQAELTVLQQDWPRGTLRNPNGSPLLAAAAHIRGFVDTVVYLIKKCVLWVADLLEATDALLVSAWGPGWPTDTGLARLIPTE